MHFLPYICFFFVDIVLLMIAVPNGKCKFISYNFLVMETSTVAQVTYSLKERFWKIDPEKRIRRWQYFARIFAPWFTLVMLFVLMSLIMGMLSPLLLLSKAYMLSAAIFGIGLTIFLYKIGLILVTKRCHDFWNDGKIARFILHFNFVLSMVVSVTGLIVLLGFSKIVDILPSIIYTILNSLSNIGGIASLIMVLILLFRPGNPGDNQYGVNPIGTKIGFFG